jgi:hypothetical protein
MIHAVSKSRVEIDTVHTAPWDREWKQKVLYVRGQGILLTTTTTTFFKPRALLTLRPTNAPPISGTGDDISSPGGI